MERIQRTSLSYRAKIEERNTLGSEVRLAFLFAIYKRPSRITMPTIAPPMPPTPMIFLTKPKASSGLVWYRAIMVAGVMQCQVDR